MKETSYIMLEGSGYWHSPKAFKLLEDHIKVGDKVITEGYSSNYDGKILTINKIGN